MATDYNQLLCEKMQKEFDNLIEEIQIQRTGRDFETHLRAYD